MWAYFRDLPADQPAPLSARDAFFADLAWNVTDQLMRVGMGMLIGFLVAGVLMVVTGTNEYGGIGVIAGIGLGYFYPKWLPTLKRFFKAKPPAT